MPKYDLFDVCEKYGIRDFGDKDLQLDYQNLVKILLMEKIANELAEQNRLKKIELKLKVIKMSTTVSMDYDPSLGKEEATVWYGEIIDEGSHSFSSVKEIEK